jgi:hypothetical protein
MKTKVCSKCNIEKSVEEFGKSKSSKDGLYPSCKVCVNERLKKYRKENPEKVRLSKKKYYQKNIEKYRVINRNWRKENPDYMKEYSKDYYENNKDVILEKSKKYYESNKEKILENSKLYTKENWDKIVKYQKKYRSKNKNSINEYMSKYKKQRRQSDDIFNIIERVRNRMRKIFYNFNTKKKNKTFDIVGCSPTFLKGYIEKQFKDGMSWENRNEWHIDHIIPLSSAETEERLYELCHYTNLQPLWAEENMKKSDKILL